MNSTLPFIIVYTILHNSKHAYIYFVSSCRRMAPIYRMRTPILHILTPLYLNALLLLFVLLPHGATRSRLWDWMVVLQGHCRSGSVYQQLLINDVSCET